MPRLPSSQNVPQIQGTRDPGVQVPAGAFKSTAGIVAEELAPAIDKYAKALIREENRESAVDRAHWSISKSQEWESEVTRLNVEDDLSNQDTLKGLGAFMAQGKLDALEKHRGSPDSRALLEIKLNEIESKVTSKAAALSHEIGLGKVKKVYDTTLTELSSRVAANPTPENIGKAYLDLDSEISNMAGAFDPIGEEKSRAFGREHITLSAIDASLARGRIETAGSLVDGFIGSLSPDKQLTVRRRIEDMRFARDEMIRKVAANEAVLGRPMTPDEKVQMLGIGPKAPLVSIQNTGETSRAKAEGEAIAKITTTDLPQVRRQIGQLTAMENLLQKGAETGGINQLRLQAANFFGVSPESLGTGSDLAAFQAVANSATLTKSMELKGAISERELGFIQNAVASAGASPESNRAVLFLQKKLLERERDSLQLMDRYHTAKGTLSGFGDYLTQWAESHPLFSETEVSQIQTHLTGEVPAISSQKEFDKLPSGAKYKWGGKEYIKK